MMGEGRGKVREPRASSFQKGGKGRGRAGIGWDTDREGGVSTVVTDGGMYVSPSESWAEMAWMQVDMKKEARRSESLCFFFQLQGPPTDVCKPGFHT